VEINVKEAKKKRTGAVPWQPAFQWFCTCPKPSKARDKYLRLGAHAYKVCQCGKVILNKRLPHRSVSK